MEKTRRKWIILMVMAVFFGAWVLIGNTGISAGEETQGVTKDAIKIGTFAPFTGRAAMRKMKRHGAQLQKW